MSPALKVVAHPSRYIEEIKLHFPGILAKSTLFIQFTPYSPEI